MIPQLPELETTFNQLNLAEPILRALRKKNYTVPSPIQAQAIPIILEGGDLLGAAQTGTGKTAAFCLPLLHRLASSGRPAGPHHFRALILTPTRELAAQIGDNLALYGKHLNLRHAIVYGGVGQHPQVRALRRGLDILIATPGRLLDLHRQGHLKFDRVEIFVLDEADRMLDMGFIHDIKKVAAAIPARRQSLFFSATLAPEVAALAQTILDRPRRITIASKQTTAVGIEQRMAFVDAGEKALLLDHLLKTQAQTEGRNLTLIFSRTKHGANRLAENLTTRGARAEAIHGNKSQSARLKALERFRRGETSVLVATDVAARGIDVKDISLVINHDLPEDAESYVHRIGRTARAGAQGQAISFCSREEIYYLREIEKLIRTPVPAWREHAYHAEEVERLHLSGDRVAKPTRGGGRNRQASPKPPRHRSRGPKSSRGKRQRHAAGTR
ncbi:MAG: DEAD/DEAH box helicase [Verrucomicrobiota bacterium]